MKPNIINHYADYRYYILDKIAFASALTGTIDKKTFIKYLVLTSLDVSPTYRKSNDGSKIMFKARGANKSTVEGILSGGLLGFTGHTFEQIHNELAKKDWQDTTV